MHIFCCKRMGCATQLGAMVCSLQWVACCPSCGRCVDVELKLRCHSTMPGQPEVPFLVGQFRVQDMIPVFYRKASSVNSSWIFSGFQYTGIALPKLVVVKFSHSCFSCPCTEMLWISSPLQHDSVQRAMSSTDAFLLFLLAAHHRMVAHGQPGVSQWKGERPMANFMPLCGMHSRMSWGTIPSLAQRIHGMCRACLCHPSHTAQAQEHMAIYSKAQPKHCLPATPALVEKSRRTCSPAGACLTIWLC